MSDVRSYFLSFLPFSILCAQAPVPYPCPLQLYTHKDFYVCFSLCFCLVFSLSHWASLPLWVHMANYNRLNPVSHVLFKGLLY